VQYDCSKINKEGKQKSLQSKYFKGKQTKTLRKKEAVGVGVEPTRSS
jgi:hypothetical protein